MLRSTTAVFGRERELAAVEGFLGADRGPSAALVLEGPAGIGKTAIWAEALCPGPWRAAPSFGPVAALSPTMWTRAHQPAPLS